MELYNIDYIPGRELVALGLVRGSTIQAKNVVSDVGQGLKGLVGGELKSYTQMMENARNIATQRMIEDAAAHQADAVINVRYATSAVTQGAAEILCYGTAVRFK